MSGHVQNLNAVNNAELKEKLSHIIDFIEAVPGIYAILNEKREIIFANEVLQKFVNDNDWSFLNKRPGEVLICKHAFENETGCGTTETCQTCGALKAIISGLSGTKDVQECRIERTDNNSLDLRVFSTPLEIDGEKFVILALNDISNEKRREILERIFFHDILNTAGGLYGFAQLLIDFPEEVSEYKGTIFGLTERLIEEINGQKIISMAEKEDLTLNIESIECFRLINEVAESYSKTHFVTNKHIIVDSNATKKSLISDKTLLRRVILNMLKNALEAAPKGSTITIGSDEVDSEHVSFWVHNVNHIPETVKLQIFKRSFSTKGNGRGLGTYSMKLLTEKYLSGKIGFTSEEGKGTTFTAVYPKKPTIAKE